MNARKPVVFLDVDGPLNPYMAKPTRRPVGFETHRLRPTGWVDRRDLRVWLAPEHGPMLLDFVAEHNAELVWATTWEHDANRFIGPAIGLPELPVVEWGFTAFHWKFDAMLAYAGKRPLVFFDDFDGDKARYSSEIEWFEAQRGDLPTRLHFVDPRIGLTELDFSLAGMWLKKLKENSD
jgi:hypothetical protein